MKKRIVSLLLAVLLLVGTLSIPVSAASAKDVYNYLKGIAMSGNYDSDGKCWYTAFQVDSSNGIYYAICYMESDKYMELALFNSSVEVVWRISSNPSPSYTAYIGLNDEKESKGTVYIAANYNGGDFASFRTFTGDTSMKSDMLKALNSLLPAVVELTRIFIYDGGVLSRLR